jgi:RHS repeat-associated protein
VQVGAACDYLYDALYRLTAASGREHSGQTAFALSPGDASQRDYPFVGARVHPNDLQGGLRDYVERYRYDAVGNIMDLAHHAGSNIDQPGPVLWHRRYQYALDSNRLLATSLPGDPDNMPDYAEAGSYTAKYSHDAHGNITRMVHLPLMRWDFKDQLSASSQQVVNNGTPETTYYVYAADGQRARKIIETQTGALKNERLYLGGHEIYREYSGGSVSLERETLHVMDDKQRIAIAETPTTPADAPRIRYQFGNHLGSASVEFDQGGALISYEEYHPYGTTAFQAGRSAAEVSLKRYRYTGKERDDETGLSYHGARYYAPWLGRWVTSDPAGVTGGLNSYAYAHGNPARLKDDNGMWPEFVDNFRRDPVGAAKQAAQTYGNVLVGYTEARVAALSDTAQLLNPVTGAAKLGAGLVEKAATEIKEVKAAYHEGGGGAKGTAMAVSRALAGSVVAHTTDAMVAAHKAGASPAKVIDAGLSKLSDETNQVNPFYHLGVATVGAPVAAVEAVQRGDPSAAGRHMAEGQASAEQAAQALVPIAQEAGLLGKGATASTLRSGGGGGGASTVTEGTPPVNVAGQTIRAATADEKARFVASMRQNRELGLATDVHGKAWLVRGEETRINLPSGRGIKYTSHTHTGQGIALFSEQDAEFFAEKEYAPGAQHTATGWKWPFTNHILGELGLEVHPDVITTVADQDKFVTRQWTVLNEGHPIIW